MNRLAILLMVMVISQSSCSKPLASHGEGNSKTSGSCWMKLINPTRVIDIGPDVIRKSSYIFFDENYINITKVEFEGACDKHREGSGYEVMNGREVFSVESYVDKMAKERALNIDAVNEIDHGKENPFVGHSEDCYFKAMGLGEDSISFSSRISTKTNLPILLSISSGGKTKVLLWKDCNKAKNIAASYDWLSREVYR